MLITFNIKESTRDIIKLILNKVDKPPEKDISYLSGKPSNDYIFMVDNRHPDSEQNVATISIGSPNHMTITTAWSRFKYRFDQKTCTYSGAYRGLMEQTLLPPFTPIFDGTERIVTSFGRYGILLLEYMKIQEEIFRIKEDHGAGIVMMHPHCLAHLTNKS